MQRSQTTFLQNTKEIEEEEEENKEDYKVSLGIFFAPSRNKASKRQLKHSNTDQYVSEVCLSFFVPAPTLITRRTWFWASQLSGRDTGTVILPVAHGCLLINITKTDCHSGCLKSKGFWSNEEICNSNNAPPPQWRQKSNQGTWGENLFLRFLDYGPVRGTKAYVLFFVFFFQICALRRSR